MAYSKEDVKELIGMEDVYNLLEYLDAEPQMFSTHIVAKTICHGGHTHKLYYYENTALFRCYSGECDTFDIFELIQKVQIAENLDQAIYFIVNFFNLQGQVDSGNDFDIEDFKIFDRLKKLLNVKSYRTDEIELKEIPNYIQYYPQPEIVPWTEEGISKEVCDYMGIRYNPVDGSILIPHYDKNNRLVGIRQRTLVKEDEKYGKYRPARIQGQLCNHPLAFNLYGIGQAKENIEKMGTAIVVESEKSVLQYMSYFGTKSNICDAACGSSLSQYQFQMLLDCGVKEVVLGLDKDFQELYTEEYDQTVRKIDKLYKKFYNRVSISVLFDKYNLLGYKNSPLDCGKEVFLYLWRHRIIS